ncbi:MAG: pyridoxal phosphate-dependent aminotransferase family protein [Planctomycetes bacterium]|nr:pyridoxal phosphate-dependent aminotransferase family protein [Planctomycetota bacterium]
MIHFGGNDYLDLARHPRVVEAAVRALREWGASSCASRVSVGTLPVHQELEARLARFLGFEEAVALSSGYLAALAAFNPFHGAEVLLDGGAHPSLQNGALASGASIRPFAHFDAVDLERRLEEWKSGGRGSQGVPAAERPLAAVEGVDGFGGVVAPLDRLYPASAGAGLTLLVDDAHGAGVLGARGRGTAELFDLPRENLVIIGSLGKAFGSSGGFVAGSRSLMERVRGGAAYRGSTALAPGAAAAALAALELVEEEPWRRERALALGRKLRLGMERQGLPVAGRPARRNGDQVDFPVVALNFPGPEEAAAVAAGLLERRIKVAHFAYASSGSASRLRIPLSARHQEGDIDALLMALEETRGSAGI